MVSVNHIRGLFSLMPNPQTITFQRYSGSDVWEDGIKVTHAESRPLSHSEKRGLEIEVTEIAKTWHIWADRLGFVEPEPNDRIIDPAGKKWHVHSMDLELADQRYRCFCVRERPTS